MFRGGVFGAVCVLSVRGIVTSPKAPGASSLKACSRDVVVSLSFFSLRQITEEAFPVGDARLREMLMRGRRRFLKDVLASRLRLNRGVRPGEDSLAVSD